jgi:tetratricopeptide (TPR) repeat protein
MSAKIAENFSKLWYSSNQAKRYMRIAKKSLLSRVAIELAVFCLVSCHRSSPESYMKSGQQKLKQADYSGAIADFSKALNLNPKLAAAYGWRGVARTKTQDADQAIADFSEAIRLKPDYAGSYANLSVAWQLKGRHDEAIKDATEAIRLNPTDAEAFYNRGSSKGGDYNSAISDLTEALKLRPNYAKAYGFRADSKRWLGDIAGANSDSNQAWQIDPRVFQRTAAAR